MKPSTEKASHGAYPARLTDFLFLSYTCRTILQQYILGTRRRDGKRVLLLHTKRMYNTLSLETSQ